MISESESEYNEQALDLGLLIELVQGYGHLYDLSNKDYKNTTKKEESWKEISEIMGVSVSELKKNWKNLRDKYMREKREKPSGSGSSSQWTLFEKMNFYEKFSRPRKTTSATPKVNQSGSGSSRPNSSCSGSVWNTLETLMSPEPNTDVEGIIDEPSCSNMKETPRKKRKLPDPDCLAIVEAANRVANVISSSKENVLPTQNEAFTQYVLSRLNSMEEKEAKLKRREMLLILENITE